MIARRSFLTGLLASLFAGPAVARSLVTVARHSTGLLPLLAAEPVSISPGIWPGSITIIRTDGGRLSFPRYAIVRDFPPESIWTSEDYPCHS